jgi:PKD repeat protein
VSFDASGSTGSIVSYSWWFDDGAGGSGVAAQHTYSVAGGYTAILTVTDSSGRTSRTGRSFTVGAAQQPPPNQPPPNQPPPNQPPPNQPPAAAFVFSPTSPGVGQLVSFDASGSSGSLLSYSWWFDDGSTGSGVKAQHTYATPGAYSPVLTITDGSGQTSRTGRSLTVGAQQPPPNQPPPNQPPPNQPPPNQPPPNQPPSGQGPVASFKFSPGSPAVGQPVSFDASGSTGSIVSYSWWFDDGGGGAGVTAQHTYGFPGSYTAILTVTDSSGRSSHVGGSFTVH